MKLAYCLECAKRYGLSKFAFIDPTHIDKGDTVFTNYQGIAGKRLQPSKVGICKYCQVQEEIIP